MERTVEAPASVAPRRQAATAPRAAQLGQLGQRLRLALVSAALALQIAWFTAIGWAGAALALLPLVLQGPPPVRAARPAVPLRLFPAPATEDVAGP